MQRIKRAIYAGAVCEQLVYTVPDRQKDLRRAPRIRFASDEERRQHRLGISKRKHARIFNENFDPRSLYSTLTFADDSEVHTFTEARRLRDNYIRRLQYRYPDARIIVYMGRGKHTQRIHYHMVSAGIPEHAIIAQWWYGTVIRVENLREHNFYNGVDYGRDYTGLANYLFDHWTDEQGGHRWKGTRNLRQYDRDNVALAKWAYNEAKPPRAPRGYMLVEAKRMAYGAYYYKYVIDPPRRGRKMQT